MRDSITNSRFVTLGCGFVNVLQDVGSTLIVSQCDFGDQSVCTRFSIRHCTQMVDFEIFFFLFLFGKTFQTTISCIQQVNVILTCFGNGLYMFCIRYMSKVFLASDYNVS